MGLNKEYFKSEIHVPHVKLDLIGPSWEHPQAFFNISNAIPLAYCVVRQTCRLFALDLRSQGDGAAFFFDFCCLQSGGAIAVQLCVCIDVEPACRSCNMPPAASSSLPSALKGFAQPRSCNGLEVLHPKSWRNPAQLGDRGSGQDDVGRILGRMSTISSSPEIWEGVLAAPWTPHAAPLQAFASSVGRSFNRACPR